MSSKQKTVKTATPAVVDAVKVESVAVAVAPATVVEKKVAKKTAVKKVDETPVVALALARPGLW